MKRIQILILILVMMSCRLIGSPVSKQEFLEDFTSQLRCHIEKNLENDRNGRSHENQYVFNYVFGAGSALNCDPSYIIDKVPIDADFATAMSITNNELCSYNNQNIFNIHHYGIAIWIPDNTDDTGLIGLYQSFQGISDEENIATYAKSRKDAADRIAFKPIYDEIHDYVVENLDMPDLLNNVELMVTMTFIKPLRVHRYAFSYSSETKTFHVNSPFLEPRIKEYDRYINKIEPGKYIPFAYYYYDFVTRLKGYIDYFTHDFKLPPGTTCGQIPLNTGLYAADQFVSCHCDPDLNLNEVHLLYVMHEFLWAYYGAMGAYECGNEIDYWENDLFKDYSEGNSDKDWKDYLIERIRQNGNYRYLDVSLYLFGTTFLDHNKLTPADRALMIGLLFNIPAQEIWRFDHEVERIDIVSEFLRSSVELSPANAQLFIDKLIELDLLGTIWNELLNTTWGSAEKKLLLTATFTQIAVANKAHLMNEKYFTMPENAGRTFIWRLNPWNANLADHHTYTEANYNLNGNHLVSFMHEHITDVQTQTFFNPFDTRTDGMVQIINVISDEQLHQFSPFDILCIVPGDPDKYRWNTDGGSLLADGQYTFKALFIPAITYAWFIANHEGSVTLDMFVTALEYASIGISAVVLATAGSVPVAILAGVVLLADVAAVTVPNIYAQELAGQYPDISPNERLQMVQEIQGIADAVALGAGIVDLASGLKGMSAYYRLSKYRKIGTDPQAVNPHDLYIDTYDGLIYSTKHITDLFPDDPLLMSIKLDMNPTIHKYIEDMPGETPHRIILLGWIESKPFLKNIRNAEQLRLLDKSLTNVDLLNELTRLSDADFEKLLEDFIDSGLQADEFVQNPSLVPALKYSDEAFPNAVNLCN